MTKWRSKVQNEFGKKSLFCNILHNTGEVALILTFLVWAYGRFTAPAMTEGGVVFVLFGGYYTLLIFGVWFSLLAAGLILSKIFRRKKIRKWMLLLMALTACYTFSLNLALFGFSINLINDLAVVIVASSCWLWWKLRTDYIDPKLFCKDINKLR